MTEDERFMMRAIELATRPSFTSPNPRVGAVVVRDGQVLSEGVHNGAGTPHAEAAALEGVDASGGTLYVNLEPCTHQGRMPPCAPQVIAAGISRVVAAIEDPDRRAAGRGIDALRQAGIDVVVGACEDEARRINRPYLHQRTFHRPLITVKLALSVDGRIAMADGSSKWITGERARRRVHQRRLEADAILVGAGTVIADDPSLTVRAVEASRQPARIVCDATGKVPPSSRIFQEGTVIVMTTLRCPQTTKTAWKEAGVEVVDVPESAAGVDLVAVIDNLAGRGWTEVICEGGAELSSSLLREGLVDRLDLNYGAVLMGGQGLGLGDLGVSDLGDASRWRLDELIRLDDDFIAILGRDH